MSYNLYSSLVINISLLVLIAFVLTKFSFVKKIMSEEHQSDLADQLILAIIFGLFCVFSTCTGVRINGAIQNTRVLGVLAAGMIGGPVVGMGASIIGAVHRFFYDSSSFTSVACTVSTLFEGMLGSVVWIIIKKKDWRQNPVVIFFVTFFAECMQMVIILLLAKPFDQAVVLVKVISMPMILLNSFGMLLFYSVFEEVFRQQDLMAANKIRMALKIAEECIPYIQKAVKTKDDYAAMADLIQKDSKCKKVQFLATDRKTCLNQNQVVDLPEDFPASEGVSYCEIRHYAVFAAPLKEQNSVWAYLVVYFSKQIMSVQAELDFVKGIASFFSTNYELIQVEKQKKLRQRAEFRALQSQINPHFLFNSLNTISCFCREKPDRARELLMALSVYFRNTLSATDQYMIPLSQELVHVKAYLQLEEARFEDRLEVDFNINEISEVNVPTLILQPIIENAVKHGAMKRTHGVVEITGYEEADKVVLLVHDNGPGFSKEAEKAFRDHTAKGKYGLQNVDARMRSIYGADKGLELETNEFGTTIRMNFYKVPYEKVNE